MIGEVDDTIAAIASAPGSSVRGILRISGPDALRKVAAAFGLPRFDDGWSDLDTNARRRPRVIDQKLTLDGQTGVDAELLVWPDRRSYTRQPVVEIHTLGSPPLLQWMLSHLIEAGCRLAEPGEFTMRAFLCGRLDLTQAEAVMDVIDARSEKQLQRAVSQVAGGIADPIADVRRMLLDVLAELEAGLDFVEEDIEFISGDQILASLRTAQHRLQEVNEQIQHRQLLDDRITAVLLGRPNVGKSSLFNRLAGAEAIVSDVRGTTRDYIKAQLPAASMAIDLVDTAGLTADRDEWADSAEPDDRHVLETLSTAQTSAQLQHADIRIVCVLADQPLSPLERSWLETCPDTSLLVRTQCDRVAPRDDLPPAIATSAISQLGMDQLKAAIIATAERLAGADAGLSSTMMRTADSFAAATRSINLGIDAVEGGWGEEIVAAEVRTALDHLGRIVGAVYTDDILDVVFSRFCIGK